VKGSDSDLAKDKPACIVQMLLSLAEVIDTRTAVSAALYCEYRALAAWLTSRPFDSSAGIDALFESVRAR
jgi:hypothetical protein